MADVNLPSINELSQMQFLPAAQYQMARDNIGLANQFQQQNLQKGDYDLQAALLKNNFDAANDPIRLQTNSALRDSNVAKATEDTTNSRIRQQFLPEEIEAKRDAFVKSKNEAQLANLYTRAETDYLNPDTPEEKRQAAKEAMGRTSKELFERNKAKDALEKQGAELTSKEGIARAEIAGRTDVANIAAGSREKVAAARQKIDGSVQDQIMKAKTPDAQAAIYDGAAEKAELVGDNELAATYKSKAANVRGISTNNRLGGAGIAATKVLDMEATARTGIPTYKENPLTPPPAALPMPNRRNAQMAPPVPMAAPSGPTNTSESKMSGSIANPSFDSAAVAREIQAIQKDLNDPAKARVLTAVDRKNMQDQILQLAHQLNNAGQTGVVRSIGTPVQSGVQAPPAQTTKGLPDGSKLIGTSGGKPVYQTPDGKKFIGE